MKAAQVFLAGRSGGGGTEMMKAIRAALDPSDAQDHVRIVCFMTDGYVGSDFEIIGEVKRHPNARVFSFGIGSSVNRFLLDGMARAGRGEVEYVALNEDGSAAARRFHERVRNPLLTDISIDWGGLPVADIYPAQIPDLFSAKPVVIRGRYTRGARGTIRLKGRVAGLDFTRSIQVTLPESEPRHDVLAALWARTRIDDLMAQDLEGLQRGTTRPEVKDAITKLGLEYRLMTQFTSFVAVEEMIITDGGQPRRIDVPVEMPEGVSYEGVFGRKKEMDFRAGQAPMAAGAVNTLSGRLSAPPAPQAQAMTVTVEAVAIDAEKGARSDRPHKPAETKAAQKLHPALAALVEKLKTQPRPDTSQLKFVRNGKAEIQVWLNDDSPATIEKLKAAGLEIIAQPKTAKLVLGRIALDKLAALAELKEVRYIAPQS